MSTHKSPRKLNIEHHLINNQLWTVLVVTSLVLYIDLFYDCSYVTQMNLVTTRLCIMIYLDHEHSYTWHRKPMQNSRNNLVLFDIWTDTKMCQSQIHFHKSNHIILYKNAFPCVRKLSKTDRILLKLGICTICDL